MACICQCCTFWFIHLNPFRRQAKQFRGGGFVQLYSWFEDVLAGGPSGWHGEHTLGSRDGERNFDVLFFSLAAQLFVLLAKLVQVAVAVCRSLHQCSCTMLLVNLVYFRGVILEGSDPFS